MLNKKIKKVILMGRKKEAVKAVRYLVNKGINLAAIVGVENDPFHKELSNTAEKYKIPFFLEESILYDLIKKKDSSINNVDLVISYFYPKKIKDPLIKLGKIGCINLHPAPLPDYKSSAGYNIAILEERKEYGVSAHFIDFEKFDSGPIIKVLKFPISKSENMMSLYEKTQEKLFKLFKEVIILFQSGEKIKTYENKGGLYLNREQLEDLKNIDLQKDSIELINKKIRAFFFPPYNGAKIKIDNLEFTLVNKEMLKYINKFIKK